MNLGGYTLTCSELYIKNVKKCSVSNGTITSNDGSNAIAVIRECEVTISDCTLNADDYYALYVYGLANVTVSNSTLNHGMLINGGSLTATDNVTVNKLSSYGICVTSNGTATFNFNPSSLLANTNVHTVTANDNNTWTVTGS